MLVLDVECRKVIYYDTGNYWVMDSANIERALIDFGWTAMYALQRYQAGGEWTQRTILVEFADHPHLNKITYECRNYYSPTQKFPKDSFTYPKIPYRLEIGLHVHRNQYISLANIP